MDKQLMVASVVMQVLYQTIVFSGLVQIYRSEEVPTLTEDHELLTITERTQCISLVK